MEAAVLRRVRVEVRPEGGKAIGGAGSCGEGADAAGSVISAESAPCGVLDVGGTCWATLVAAAGASAEPVPPPEGTAKTEAKAVSVAGEKSPRPGRQSPVVMAAVTRAMNLPEGAEKSSILIRGPCVRKSQKSEEVKVNPPKIALSGWGTNPLKPTPGIGEARVRSPQARLRKIPPSSTAMRLPDPVRSCSVTGAGKTEQKIGISELPPRYSRVQSNAVRNSSHRWTRAL